MTNALSCSNARDKSTSVGNQEKNGKRFKLATFNVRGLTKRVKQEKLSRDIYFLMYIELKLT